ncbi:MAG: lysophospholipid acyltransferase family protein [Kofleriaceae bacterium]
MTSVRERILREATFHDAGYGYDIFGLHPPVLAGFVAAARPIYERYFRVKSSGATRIPEGPVVLIANHAGILPVDGAMLCLDVLLQSNPTRIPRAITDHFVPRLPLVSTLFARLGVVSGTRANVRQLLERGELLVIFPEGVSGPAKRFRERYTIQKWSAGFAELAIRHRASIVPVSILGSEESWPLVTKLGVHVFGAPYIPIPLSPVPLPVHYELRYGSPLKFDMSPRDADDPLAVATVAAEACQALEQLIADARMVRRGVFR